MAIITISRGTLSGGTQLAEMLAEKLGYRCVSREIIVKAAADYGVAESKLFDAIGHAPTLLQKLTFERERYLAYIQASLCEYAKDDNLVYHGHAGHFLLDGIAHVLRLRLVADMPYRVRAAMKERDLTEKEAAKYIAKVDKDRYNWTQFLYGKDWSSPELYDIVFNLERVDLNFVYQVVHCAIQQAQFRTTPESAKAMQDLLIASRTRAALAGLPNIRLDKLLVEAHDGAVTVQGIVKSRDLSDAVTEAAARVDGVTSVDNQVQIDYRSIGVN